MASLVATAQTGDAQLEDLRSKLDGLLRDAAGRLVRLLPRLLSPWEDRPLSVLAPLS